MERQRRRVDWRRYKPCPAPQNDHSDDCGGGERQEPGDVDPEEVRDAVPSRAPGHISARDKTRAQVPVPTIGHHFQFIHCITP